MEEGSNIDRKNDGGLTPTDDTSSSISAGPEPIAGEQSTATNMEVHHHPHLPHGEKKKLKEYFLEFLMIFLAVTLGFIAESLREHASDRAKEREYITSFIEGLKADTVSLAHTINFNNQKLPGFDSLIALSKTDLSKRENQFKFYQLNLTYLNSYSRFHSNDAVMLQLKNSGGLRLIQKDHVADSLALYDESVSNTYSQADVYLQLFNELEKIQQEMLDFTFLTDSSYFHGSNLTQKPLPLFTPDPAKLRLFFNKVVSYKFVLDFYDNQLLKMQLASATRLMAFLRDEYGLKNE